MGYDPEFDGGLCTPDENDNTIQSTRYQIESIELSTLEHYVKHNTLEFDTMRPAPIRINANLYMIISRVFNHQKQSDNQSLIRLNSCILNMGVKVFVDRIGQNSFNQLLDKVDEYADGNVLGEFNTNCDLIKMHEPGYVFKQAYTQNWNQDGGTVSTNFYMSELLGTKFANIATFGFKGRSGSKLTREFLILLGLRQSELLREKSRVYERILTITDRTLKTFEQMVVQSQ